VYKISEGTRRYFLGCAEPAGGFRKVRALSGRFVMRSEAQLRSSSTISRVRTRWKVLSTGSLLLLLAAGVLPRGQGQQNQTQQAPAAPAQTASAAPQPADPVRAPEPPVARPPAGQGEQRPATESAALLKLAMELKADVDKSSKDTLSLAVIRKADEIERMAHGMKDRYRASAGIN
jgi:hypothetical protein